MTRYLVLSLLIAFATLAQARSSSTATVATHELAERLTLYDGEGGATCSHFMAKILPWEHRGGDWYDVRGKAFGSEPFALAKVGPQGADFNVTAMLREWVESGAKQAEFFLRALGGTGYVHFHSKEGRKVTDWPLLVLEYTNGSREMLTPNADTTIDCSTYVSRGQLETLMVSGIHNTLLQFALPVSDGKRELKSARLILASAQFGGTLEVGVFAIRMPIFQASPVEQGLAAAYPYDHGIEKNPDVVFATGFEEGNGWGGWRSRWSKEGKGEMEVLSQDPKLGFSPLEGASLRINLKQGSNYGADLRLYLKEHGGEPNELYFRYYLRLASDWNPTVADGKLPGMAGTYGEGGWGGRRVDGSNGWSMRGLFIRAFERKHPMYGLTQIGTYAYHADMKDYYGDFWIWPGALLARNRWYCIEQFVRVNRPGMSDGSLKVWVDGRLAMERSNIRMRTVDRFRIEAVWINAYHGGAETSPYDQHIFVDNVVVARRYIGPMKTGK